MKLATSLASLSAALLLSACETQPHTMTHDTVTTQALSLKGEHGLLMSNNMWLSYGPKDVITLSDQSQKNIDSTKHHAEYMDHREHQGQTQVFAIDEHNQPLLIKNNNQQLSIKSGKLNLPPLEGACLYQPNNGALEVFLLDEDHMAHQYYIKENSDNIELTLLRHFPLPPGTEYCAVHDESNQLFVSEENIGVWAYSARAESEVKRRPVDLAAPYGKLTVNAGPLAIVDDQLYVAQSGSPYVNQYAIKNTNYRLIHQTQLDENIELDSLTASIDSQSRIVFSAIDDASENLISWQSAYTQKHDSNNNIVNIPASGETTPVESQGDAADDPAIWINRNAPEKSIILGTNKKRGLYTYNLAGQEQQALLAGRVNNVDVRQGFTHKGRAADIAAASQRDRNSIALFSIDPNTGFVSIANEIVTGLDSVYGLCMYQGLQDKVYVFINDQDGRFEQWQIIDQHDGWKGKLVREFSVDTQPEGCTVDESAQRLFIGEENVALWALGAEPNDSTKMEVVAKEGGILTADIEGMEIYAGSDKNWLVVSSQGNDSYVIFDAAPPYQAMGEFRITRNDKLGIDGASETDGLTVSSVSLGDAYPEGVLIVQDGRNFLPQETQNFKLVSWRDVRQALKLQ